MTKYQIIGRKARCAGIRSVRIMCETTEAMVYLQTISSNSPGLLIEIDVFSFKNVLQIVLHSHNLGIDSVTAFPATWKTWKCQGILIFLRFRYSQTCIV